MMGRKAKLLTSIDDIIFDNEYSYYDSEIIYLAIQK